MKYVHIAGTNGKGSVALKIAKGLERVGHRVGLFTSPHLFSPTERIVINGQPIAQEKIADCTTEESMPVFFQKMTVRAFEYFAAENVDYAVIEAGIGGLLDSTNIITPVISVITSIAKDHAHLLGETLEEIAFQKAGIIKPGVPVIIGPKADFPIMHEKASRLHIVERVQGFYDLENAAIARKALEVLGVPEYAIVEGLKHRPRCRFEQQGNVIFDVAHNPDGFKRLLEAIEIHFPGQPFKAAVGMSKDKEIEKCLSLLAEKAQHIYLLQASSLRAAPIEEMASILDRIGYKNFSKELVLPQKDLLVVCGTFFIMEEAHCRLLRGKERVK